ncbi:PAS domain-containing sensor histidine kinase [Anaeromyxobacter oryzae]|uniref:PAS domain-containing sensor histidine kinase n=1 Tax=Anaeromyxobacter oryzae TaxID=2918170 RepID=UPI0020C0199A|nr:PAS domain-containing sensor histidine kinase [Anaeromyxobacter oryzae]
MASVRDYAIFMLDPKGYIVTWNLGAERIKGYTESEIVGSHFSVFYPAEDNAAGKPDWELAEAERLGRFEDEGWRLRKDGSRFWANVIITALRDPGGVLRGFGKVTRDLTARREAEETARRLAAEQAARSMAEKTERYQRDLLAILGHDLRNCLSVIVTAGEMNRLQAENEKIRRRATQVVSTAKRMRHIIHSIIDYTYAQREGVPIVPREGADFHGVCERVLQEFRTLHPQRLILYEAEGNPLGTWDEGRLEQVVQNLLGNALKYSPPDSTVSVRWAREGDHVNGALVLSVHNEGPPIPPELVAHMFEPFRSGERLATSDDGSMGLGLFIVREIVRAHGGETSAQSDAEHGTTFTVTLPPRSPAGARPSQ